MIAGLLATARYWFPPRVDESVVRPRLERFYATRQDYHAMTACEDKVTHPQVKLLMSLIRPEHRVIEFGCGGGVVLSAIGRLACTTMGCDLSAIALAKARSRPGKHSVAQADIARMPFPDNCADLVYSLEVLEHVWNPATVILEMIRVTRPGGTIFFTTPNGYSMNMHLKQRKSVRAANYAGALGAGWLASRRTEPYQNVPPDLDASPVYPDCDMITRIHPRELSRFMTRAGCTVERLETYFFLEKKASSEAELAKFRKLAAGRFHRWHGDHILLVGRKMANKA